MGYELNAPCPLCGVDLTLRRISDINIVEYQAHCESCGWKGSLKRLQCGGCHGRRFFKWTGDGWCCIRCGHIRTDPSPPRGGLNFNMSARPDD